MQRLWWSWEGGGGREAYDSADNKWALYAVARDSHSCSSPCSLEAVWVGEEATKAQANEDDIGKTLMTQSCFSLEDETVAEHLLLAVKQGLLWAGGLSAGVPPGQGMPSRGSVQLVSFPCVTGEYLEPLLARGLICFLLSLERSW